MNIFNKYSHKGLTVIQDVALLIIALSTVYAMGQEVYAMYLARSVHLADLLLLFIYLEVLAMVAIYLDSGKLPIRMPLYIAIVALARYMMIDMKNLDTLRLLGIAGAALILAMGVLLIRYGHIRFPYHKTDEGD